MEYIIKLSRFAVSAANHCMQGTEAKGRVEVRCHSGISRALRDGCQEDKTIKHPQTGQDIQVTETKEGSITINEDRFVYFKKIVDDKMRSSIPGPLTIGYDELSEAIEKAVPPETKP